MHSTLDTPEREADLARLDEMIATSKDMGTDLLLEHLQKCTSIFIGRYAGGVFGQPGMGTDRFGYGA